MKLNGIILGAIMKKEYEIIVEKVLAGTIRANEKLKAEAERTGRKLVVASEFLKDKKPTN